MTRPKVIKTNYKSRISELIQQLSQEEQPDDQVLIALEGLRLTRMLLDKNEKYRSSFRDTHPYNPHVTPLDCIDIRIADKMKRLSYLRGGGQSSSDESERDTTLDSAGYFVLRSVLLQTGPMPHEV